MIARRKLAGTVMTTLRRLYGRQTASEQGSALEALMLGILEDGAPDGKAATALRRLLRHFVDWNEVRVGDPHEIADALSGVPNAVEKAQIMRAVLDRLVERTCELSLEYLRDKSQREALRLINGIEGFPESALARTICIELDHDVMPLTPKITMICRRLGLLKQGLDQKTSLRRVQSAVSKAQMFEFHSLLARHVANTCFESNPDCLACKLASHCSEGKKIVRAAKRGARAKSRRTKKRVKKKSAKTKKVARKKSPKTKTTERKASVKRKSVKRKPVKRKSIKRKAPVKRKSVKRKTSRK